jgi:hypothetical protein
VEHLYRLPLGPKVSLVTFGRTSHSAESGAHHAAKEHAADRGDDLGVPGHAAASGAFSRLVSSAVLARWQSAQVPRVAEPVGVAALVAEQLGGLALDRRRGVGLLVWVHPDHSHIHRPSLDIA